MADRCENTLPGELASSPTIGHDLRFVHTEFLIG